MTSVRETAMMAPTPIRAVVERAVWRTAKFRAEDIKPGDVTRNSFGKWARVIGVSIDRMYVTVQFDTGGTVVLRDVHLIDIQEVKPS
jgi:hypothetical protein